MQVECDSLCLPAGISVCDLPAILVDLPLDGEIGLLREEIVAGITGYKGGLDGIINAIFLIRLRLHITKVRANGMTIEEHSRVQGQHDIIHIRRTRTGVNSLIAHHGLGQLLEHLHVDGVRVGSKDGRGRLIALCLILLRSDRVAGVNVGQAGDDDFRVDVTSCLGSSANLIPQATTSHCGEFTRHRGNDDIANLQQLGGDNFRLPLVGESCLEERRVESGKREY